MDPQSFVFSAMILLVTTSVAVALFRHFGLGSVLGLLVAGILIGPHTPGPRLVEDAEQLRHFTELGVVLLLFLIGLEMQPRRLWSMRREMFGLGGLQVLISGLAIAGYASFSQASWRTALILGLALALSSTAFVMQILQERGEVASRHGQTAFAVLLMQDLAIVPLLALVPILAEVGPLSNEVPTWQQVMMVLGVFGVVLGGGHFLVRPALNYLARNHNREGFFLVALAAVFVAAWAMEQAGLSMALGAFLMGVMLSTSRYHYQIQATIEPHKGLLMSLFFVAVGMSIDLQALAAQPLVFALHVGAVMAIKILVLAGLGVLFRLGRAASVRVAFLLAQSGEFGYVLFGSAKALAVIDDATFIAGVGVISLTMSLTPLLVRLGDRLAVPLEDAAARPLSKYQFSVEVAESGARVLVAGYGRMGHTVGTILTSSGIPFIAFDVDPAKVAYWREQGHPIYYGDIADANLLACVRLEGVDLVVMTIESGRAAVRAASLIRHLAPKLPIVARARDLAACDELMGAGVTRALPEALEASLRIAAESLEILGTAGEETDALMRGVRGADYEILREGGGVGPVSPVPSRKA